MSGWVAGALVVGTVASSAISANASSKAAEGQQAAAALANETQNRQYQQTQQNQAPYMQAGTNALNALQGVYGLPSQQNFDSQAYLAAHPDVANDSYWGSHPWEHYQKYQNIDPGTYKYIGAQNPEQIIQNQPGYQFQLQQGQNAVNSNLSARGLLGSGAGAKALTQYGQGAASNYMSQYTGGLQSLAGLGQNATQATSQAGQNTANQIGSNQIYSGNASAYGTVGNANAINQGLSGIAQGFGMYAGTQNQNPYSPGMNGSQTALNNWTPFFQTNTNMLP